MFYVQWACQVKFILIITWRGHTRERSSGPKIGLIKVKTLITVKLFLLSQKLAKISQAQKIFKIFKYFGRPSQFRVWKEMVHHKLTFVKWRSKQLWWSWMARNKPELLIESPLNLELDNSVKVDIGVEGGVMDTAPIEPWKEVPSSWRMSSPDMGNGVIWKKIDNFIQPG